MTNKTNGFGNYIIAWKWEFQKMHGCMGWTYWLYYDDQVGAKDYIEHIKQYYPNDSYQLTESNKNSSDYFNLIP